ncbi:MAG: sulfite exporter TauE/SafE family protein [Campylobacteraceae bacterium]|nr:sulfite exporter TauE/SafE family protein [Campylobacteraceae bacterium]
MDLIITVSFFTFLTSTLSAITGVGGGMALIAILPSFLSANILIPIHGLSQLFSNISRAVFSYKDIYKKAVPLYFMGSILGVTLSSSFFLLLSFTYIPLFIAIYILLSLWSKKFDFYIKRFENYFILGFLQSSLSLIVGATGALAMPKLIKDCRNNNQVVVSVAALSAITHLLKIIVFIFLGFSFLEHVNLIISMSISAILGSYIGTFFRKKFNSNKLLLLIKIILTILAVKSIYQVLIII